MPCWPSLLLVLHIVLVLPSTSATSDSPHVSSSRAVHPQHRLPSGPPSQLIATDPVVECGLSFGWLLRNVSWRTYTDAGARVPLRHRCPPNCIAAMQEGCRSGGTSRTPAGGAAVIGSFPYHPNSSVCLSAVHSGLVDDATGGAVLPSLFFSQTWDSNTIDIYPHGSQSGTCSNGVQSLDVPPSELASLTIHSYSFTLHSRGTVFNQRRWAPWTPRAGHLHLARNVFMQWDGLNYYRHGFHLVCGGRNATHYRNDCWLYSTAIDLQQPYSSSVGRWQQLPDAPWSPRAFMSHAAVLYWRGRESSVCLLGSCRLDVTVMNGEVGTACGLAELGVCVAEAWKLLVIWNASSPLNFSLQWSAAAVQLPFPGRCGGLLMQESDAPADGSLLDSRAGRFVTAVMGGQLSYADPTCSSPPASLNDVWYNYDSQEAEPLLLWTQGPDAPWSPRRSMATQPDVFPSSFNVMGGVRFLSFSQDAATARSVWTAAELYADVWVCQLAMNVSHGWQCDWRPSIGQEVVSAADWSVAGSLPVPIAYTPQGWAGHVMDELCWTGVLFSGATTQAALDRWLSSNVTVAVDGFELSTPVSNIQQPTLLGTVFASPTEQDVMDSRYGLPLVYSLGQAELNNASSPFNLGGAGLVTAFNRQYQDGNTITSPSYITAHQLPSQQLDNAPFIHSPRPAINTSRGALDFVFARLSYGAQPYSSLASSQECQTLVLSGGSSGGLYYNDWLELQQTTWDTMQVEGAVGCLPPDDPSYNPLLGAGRHSDCGWPPSHRAPVDSLIYPATYSCRWRCDNGSHLEPPAEFGTDSAVLFCLSDGLWHDAAINSFRRCVRDRLLCHFPYVEAGDGQCLEPQPLISRISIAASQDNSTAVCVQANATTLTGCPAQPLRLQLVGRWFALPLVVWIGGHLCLHPQLQDVAGNSTLCANHTADSTSPCLQYGSGIGCTVPGMGAGVNLPVTVLSGPSSRLAVVQSEDDAPATAVISYAMPRITALSANECRLKHGTALQLVGCPNLRSFQLTIVGINLLLPTAAAHLPEVYMANVAFDQLLCTWPTLQQQDGALSLAVCTVPAGVGSLLPLLIHVGGLGDNSAQFTLPAAERPGISYEVCPAGTFTNYSGWTDSGASGGHCQQCPAGSSTEGRDDQRVCSPCLAGTYNNGTGYGFCESCEAGLWSPTASESCLNCSVNSYSLSEGAPACVGCVLNQYLQYELGSSSAPQCRSCLPRATCSPNGTISAHRGVYILIDPHTTSISAVDCHNGACLDGGGCMADIRAAPLIPLSHLPVVNCCGPHRRPAADNLLCAECEDGYAEWRGQCAVCDCDNTAVVAGLALLLFLFLYILHRLPASASARLDLAMYYLQMSLLFNMHGSLPLWLSVINLQLLGDFHSVAGPSSSSWSDSALCLAPLSGWDKVALQLLMPLYLLCNLLLLLVLDKGCQRILIDARRTRGSATLHDFVFPRPELEPILSPRPRDLSSASSESMGSSLEDCGAEEKSGLQSAATVSASAFVAHSYIPQLRLALLPYRRSVLRLALYSYTPVATTALFFFHCQQLPAGYGSRMYYHPSIDCTSSTYGRFRPAMIAVLILLVLGPCLTAACLMLQRRQRRFPLQSNPASLLESQSLAAARLRNSAMYQVMCAAYRDECWYWSVLLVLQRGLLVCVYVFVPSPVSFVVLSLMNVSVLTINALSWPYARLQDNQLCCTLHFVLLMQTMILSLYPPSIASTTAFLVLSFALLLVISMLSLAPSAAGTRVAAVLREAVGWSTRRMCSFCG